MRILVSATIASHVKTKWCETHTQKSVKVFRTTLCSSIFSSTGCRICSLISHKWIMSLISCCLQEQDQCSDRRIVRLHHRIWTEALVSKSNIHSRPYHQFSLESISLSQRHVSYCILPHDKHLHEQTIDRYPHMILNKCLPSYLERGKKRIEYSRVGALCRVVGLSVSN